MTVSLNLASDLVGSPLVVGSDCLQNIQHNDVGHGQYVLIDTFRNQRKVIGCLVNNFWALPCLNRGAEDR
jgi:hypothetical protein